MNRKERTPLYKQIEARIREQIASGKYQAGDLLPSERQLCGLLGVSHITTRQALVELTREGVVHRVHGKGTYVGAGPGGRRATAALGVVIPEWQGQSQSPFVAELLSGIQSVTRDQAALTIYAETESRYILDASDGRLQGLIFLVPHVEDRMIPMLAKQKIALVVVGETDVPRVYSVDNDNVAVGAMVTRHFLEAGHRRIGFIGGPRHFTVTERRLEGCRQALREAGVTGGEDLVRCGSYAAETGTLFAPELATAGATAIFCADDMIAVGALQALRERGVRAPQDVAVAGCNNSAVSSHCWPALTTVDVFPTQIGRRSAEMLMSVLSGQAVERRSIVEAQLVVRESTVAARVAEGGGR